MYLRFDQSPHAMPLSLLFEVVGRVPLTDKLMWECCTGGRFEAVAAVDLTGNLHHTGQVMLYLPERLPRVSLFGEEGCWLRVSRSSGFQGPEPCVASVQLNTVTARQLQREPELYFNTAPYDAGKTVTLLRTPVASCEVWVDEAGALPLADAQLTGGAAAGGCAAGMGGQCVDALLGAVASMRRSGACRAGCACVRARSL